MPRSRKRKNSNGKTISGKGMHDPTQRRYYDPGVKPQVPNLTKHLERAKRTYRPKGGQRGR